MPLRITDAPSSSNTAAQISAARRRIAEAQLQISTGKRINRPSDDPQGAAAVITLRTTQAEIDQMKRNATTAGDLLLQTDGDVDSYEHLIERARVLLTQGGSDITGSESKSTIATELDSLRTRMLALANSQRDNMYVFGGTRTSEPPFDPTTGAPAASVSAERKLRIEPTLPPATVGFRGEEIFSDAAGTVFSALETASAALRSTGDPVADKAAVLAGLDRMGSFANRAGIARARIGSNLSTAEAAAQRLAEGSLAAERAAQIIEAADFAASAVQLTEGQTALEAVIKSRGATRPSLLDYLG